ncbi:MAG: MurT ligase domain-containing protein [Candidatus Saccharimonadales bacterium]
MTKPYVTLLGKGVRYIARLRGGGSALPGLFVEKIDPDFVKRTLAQLPHGVVVISGTNGKTTTTKMVVSLLESQGMRVFTNRTGSNFTRGVAAALLGEVNHRSELSADIAVLELDEAHAVHFVKTIPPRYSLLLNVMRDQLDRFGEIDTTARMLAAIGSATTDGVVINRDDPRLGSQKFIQSLQSPQQIRSYGTAADLQRQFPSDDELRADNMHPKKSSVNPTLYSDDVSLQALDGQSATISYDAKTIDVTLKLNGIYNILNSVAAVALCRMVIGGELQESAMITALQDVTPAFGRGETLTVGGQPLELVLVKNPSGFRLGLSSFDPSGYATMIAINDNYADGRDMSWLWDVEFDSLQPSGVAQLSGIRAFDMALRLQYEEVEVSNIEPDLIIALRRFIDTHPTQPKRIFCTYTAMLALRRELGKITDVEVVS